MGAAFPSMGNREAEDTATGLFFCNLALPMSLPVVPSASPQATDEDI